MNQVLRRMTLLTMQLRFEASKMQASSTQKTKDSAGRRLGVKKFGGEEAFPNDIIIRQRGLKYHPGKNTHLGVDHTIHAAVEGKVYFRSSQWRKRQFYFLDIIPEELPNRKRQPPSPYVYHPQLFPERAAKNHPPLKKLKNNWAVIDA